MKSDPLDELIQSDPEVVSAAIDRYCDRISATFDEFMANMPRLGCDAWLLSEFGHHCDNPPTVMLDEDLGRTFNEGNMEFELCPECYALHLKGKL